MARFSPAKAIYEVADLFRQRCLVAGQSLLWPDHRAWTVGTIDSLVEAFVGRANYGEGTFLNKLHDQLAAEPDDVLRVAADVLAFYFLFPSSKSVGRRRKLDTIQTIVDWRPAALAIAPSEWGLLEAAFVEGAGSTGSDYLTGRPAHLAFFLAFARGVLEGQADPYDPDSCRRLIRRSVTTSSNVPTQARHVLLHLLFPDRFERTASETHKKMMVSAFQEDAGGAADLDDALINIRRVISSASVGRIWTSTSPMSVDYGIRSRSHRDLRPAGVAGHPPSRGGMYPDPDVRRICLTVFADSIESAHAVSLTSWAARFAQDERALRLNVSWSQACVLSQDDLYLVLDADTIDAPTMEQITAAGRGGTPERGRLPFHPLRLRGPPSSRGLGDEPPDRPWRAPRVRHPLCQAGQDADTFLPCPRTGGRSSILRRELGRDLPQPDYGLAGPRVPSRRGSSRPTPPLWNLAEKLRES